MNPVKLTKKTAVMLIQRVIPLSPKLISGGAADNGAVRFTAPVGPAGLEITCENDWFTHNGCIKLTISDPISGSCLTMYFNPDTLKRDYEAEVHEKMEADIQSRRDWVQNVGPEQAHKLVDLYWG